jgi:hypothetical protein
MFLDVLFLECPQTTNVALEAFLFEMDSLVVTT